MLLPRRLGWDGLPNVVEDEETTSEICDIQIGRLADRIGVFAQAVRKSHAGGSIPLAATPTSLGVSLADVNGSLQSLAVYFSEGLVCREAAKVIDGVNTGTLKWFRR